MENTDNGKRDTEGTVWKYFDRIQGDKVVWMIVLLLMMLSVLVIFGSSSRLALQEHTDRIRIISDQSVTVIMGLLLIVLCYVWRWPKVVKWFSSLGFIVSFTMLLILVAHLDLGFIKAAEVNHSWRILKIMDKVQFHVYEFVKVAMVMYVSWAIDTHKGEGFGLTRRLRSINLYIKKKDGSKKQIFEWLEKPAWEQALYIYLPVVVCVAMTMPGSNSSALFLAILMFVTLIIGGMPMKRLILVGLGFAAIVGIALGIYRVSGAKVGRIDTLLSRIGPKPGIERYYEVKDSLKLLPAKSPKHAALRKELEDIQAKIQQPLSAEIAIHDGGLIGKGPGGSTQQYVVPIMYGDYMYAFILEEYGIWGGAIVLLLYFSLLARGSMIARNLDGRFEQIATGGLVLLISGQAFMHMMINVGIGPLTGQTLPLLSHGKGAFLMMSLAFGLILYFSRLARENMAKDAARVEEEKEMQNSLDDLDRFNNDMIDNDLQ